MRKHSARKWIHFILDLLPVFIIPIYAIYLINHEPQALSVEAEEMVQVDFNQQVSYFSSDECLKSPQISVDNLGDTTITFSSNSRWGYNLGWSIDFIKGHKYYIKGSFDVSDNNIYTFALTSTRWTARQIVSYTRTNLSYKSLFIPAENYNTFFAYTEYDGVVNEIDINNLQLFDLTQMFGSGNEPSTSEFDLLFTDPYYNKVDSELMLVNVGTLTNSNTDIGSQFVYSMYIPVRDYFNFNNVFNFGDIYHWFELNIFGGTAPMSFFIVWNIVLYEFVMDLVFLIYGLFMWFIDMCEKLMDKPLNSIK